MASAHRNQVDQQLDTSINFIPAVKNPPPPPPKRIFMLLMWLFGIPCIGIAVLAILAPDQIATIPLVGSDLARLAFGETSLLASMFGAGGGMLLLAGFTGKREYVVAPFLFSAMGLALEVVSVAQAGAGFAGATSLWVPGVATALTGAGWLALTPPASAHA